jgi:hypothetical protein
MTIVFISAQLPPEQAMNPANNDNEPKRIYGLSVIVVNVTVLIAICVMCFIVGIFLFDWIGVPQP